MKPGWYVLLHIKDENGNYPMATSIGPMSGLVATGLEYRLMKWNVGPLLTTHGPLGRLAPGGNLVISFWLAMSPADKFPEFLLKGEVLKT